MDFKKIFNKVLKKIEPLVGNENIMNDIEKNTKITEFKNDTIILETYDKTCNYLIKNIYYNNLLHGFREYIDSNDLQLLVHDGLEYQNNDSCSSSIHNNEISNNCCTDNLLNLKNNDSCNETMNQNNCKDNLFSELTTNTYLDTNLTFNNYIFAKKISKLKTKLSDVLIEFKTKHQCEAIKRCFPIFIYGNTGIGKTHFVSAFANYGIELFPNLKVLFLSSNDFTRNYLDAVNSKNVQQNLTKLKNILLDKDILIIDDFQMMSEREKTIEFFLEIINNMRNLNKILILTSDRHVESINGITDRVMSRLKGGLSVKMPTINEFEDTTHTNFIDEILKLLQFDMNLTEDAKRQLLTYYENDIRSLKGAIETLDCLIDFTDNENPLTFEEMAKILNINYTIQKQEREIEVNINPQYVINAIAQRFQVSADLIISKNRRKEVANARNIAIFLLNQKMSLSHGEIGEIFNRDRSTITTILKKVSEKHKTDTLFEKTINNIYLEISKNLHL